MAAAAFAPHRAEASGSTTGLVSHRDARGSRPPSDSGPMSGERLDSPAPASTPVGPTRSGPGVPMPRASGSAGHRGLVSWDGPAVSTGPGSPFPIWGGENRRLSLPRIHDCVGDHEFINSRTANHYFVMGAPWRAGRGARCRSGAARGHRPNPRRRSPSRPAKCRCKSLFHLTFANRSSS